MAGFKKASNPLRPSNSYNSLYDNPLVNASDNKENDSPNKPKKWSLAGKENAVPGSGAKSDLKEGVLKPSSLQLCMKKHEPDSTFGSKIFSPIDADGPSSGNLWDHSDSEAAPASSWSTLPNRSANSFFL